MNTDTNNPTAADATGGAAGDKPGIARNSQFRVDWRVVIALFAVLSVATLGSALGTTWLAKSWWLEDDEVQDRLASFARKAALDARTEGETPRDNSNGFKGSSCSENYPFDVDSFRSPITNPFCFESETSQYRITLPTEWIQSVEDERGVELMAGHPDASIRVEVSSRSPAGTAENTHLIRLQNGKTATVTTVRNDQTVEFTLVVLNDGRSLALRGKFPKDYFDNNHDLIWAVAQTFFVRE